MDEGPRGCVENGLKLLYGRFYLGLHIGGLLDPDLLVRPQRPKHLAKPASYLNYYFIFQPKDDEESKKPGSSPSTTADAKPKEKKSNEKFNGGLIKALFTSFGMQLFISAIFKLAHDLCLFAGPILLK